MQRSMADVSATSWPIFDPENEPVLGLPGPSRTCKARLGIVPICLFLQLWKGQEPFTNLRDSCAVVALPIAGAGGESGALAPPATAMEGWWIIYSLLMRKGNGERGKWGENKYVFIKNGKS